MQNVLIVSGHPDSENSYANTAVLENILKLFPDADISRLDQLYPDFQIDVKSEQEKLVNADVIIWQFPLHWYSFPALMKKYIDDVYAFGFAHGAGGDKLKGKKLILSFTTGASEDLYDYGKAMNYPIGIFCLRLSRLQNFAGWKFRSLFIPWECNISPAFIPLKL